MAFHHFSSMSIYLFKCGLILTPFLLDIQDSIPDKYWYDKDIAPLNSLNIVSYILLIACSVANY